MVLGRGKLAKIEVALSSRAEFQVKLLGSGFGRIAPVAASTSALLPSFSAFSEFESIRSANTRLTSGGKRV